LHGRVVGRRPVVEMARPVIVIRRLTDDRGAQTRVASKRARDLARVGVGVGAGAAWAWAWERRLR
jgi:hypothetical protein